MGIGDVASSVKRKKKDKGLGKKKTTSSRPAKKSNTAVRQATATSPKSIDITDRPELDNVDSVLLEAAEEFARLDDQLKELKIKKASMVQDLVQGIEAQGVKGKFLPLRDGRKVEIRVDGGGRVASKTSIVEAFGKAGTTFWDGLTPKEKVKNLSVKS